MSSVVVIGGVWPSRKNEVESPRADGMEAGGQEKRCSEVLSNSIEMFVGKRTQCGVITAFSNAWYCSNFNRSVSSVLAMSDEKLY